MTIFFSSGGSLKSSKPAISSTAPAQRQVTAINHVWGIDFVANALFDGRRLRALTVVDNYTRKSLATEVGENLKEEDVVNTLNRIATQRGLPATNQG